MIAFFAGLALLAIGYFVYGRFVEKIFGIHTTSTPANEYYDGVDYVPLSMPKNAMIHLLNIAGTGPVFGPIMGALFGPVAFILIPVGNIIGGAVHDFFIGMISLRNKGAHMPQLAGYFLGKPMKHIVNGFAVVLLILLGTVFVRSPADLLVKLFGGQSLYWGLAIYLYYAVATVLPIDKFIARIYPYFGCLLLFSAVAIFFGILIKYPQLFPEFTIKNLHPENLPIFPMFFMTVTCGLLSGFHATQSPIISRTLQTENQGRKIFYGMMVLEGFIAMVWAGAAMIVYNKAGIFNIGHFGGPAGIVDEISMDIFGSVIGSVVVLGVIVLPITSGDTSFRGLRMILADYMGLKQARISNRFLIVIPMFAISVILFFVDFNVLWRYFSWANQTTGTISLFIASGYLFIRKKKYWVTLIPAVFMLMATTSYLGNAKIGFGLEWPQAYIWGGLTSFALLTLFLWRSLRARQRNMATDHILD